MTTDKPKTWKVVLAAILDFLLVFLLGGYLTKELAMTTDKPKTWKVVLAAILDFLLVFLLGGYLIALVTGGTTQGGFSLNGWPAGVLFALVIAYFWGMKRLGGTVFQRLFGLAGKLG